MTKIIRAKHKEGRKRLTSFSRNPNTSFNKKPYRPGQHRSVVKATTVFGKLLNEKQKLKTMYNISDKKIKSIAKQVANKEKSKDRLKVLMGSLALKFDSVLFNSFIASSIYEAGQFVSHGHFLLNDKKVTFRNVILKAGDVIKFKGTDKLKQKIAENMSLLEDFSVFPSYLELDKENVSVKVIRFPENDELKYIPKFLPEIAAQAVSK